VRQGSIFLRFRRTIAAAALLFGAALLTACGSIERVDLTPACPPGIGRGPKDLGPLKGENIVPDSTEVLELLESPNFGATPQAVRDLEKGVVDQRLVAALRLLTKEHRICIQTTGQRSQVLLWCRKTWGDSFSGGRRGRIRGS
jgi:hypothetical protein